MLSKKVYLLIIFIVPLWTLAQIGLPFQQYTMEDGLPSNQIYWTTQDEKGDLWICSDHGIIAFDGVSMRSFTTENGLPDNTIFKCFPDSKGRLWFTSYSKGVFWIRNDTIHIPRFNEDLLNKIGNRWLDKIYVDNEDSIWMTSFYSDSVFYKAHINADTAITRSIPNGNLCNDLVYFIQKDKQCIISGITNSHLNYGEDPCLKDSSTIVKNIRHDILLKTGAIQSSVDPGSREEESQIRGRHRVYFSNGDQGLEWFSIRNKLFNVDKKGRIRLVHKYPVQVMDIFQEANKLYISAGDQGLHVYETKGHELELKGVYFLGLDVSHISKDRSGNYWISIINQGLYKVSSFDVLALTINIPSERLKKASKPWFYRNDSLLFLAEDSLFVFRKHENEFNLVESQKLMGQHKIKVPSRIIWDTKNGFYTNGLKWDFKKKQYTNYLIEEGADPKWVLGKQNNYVVFDRMDSYFIKKEEKIIFDSRSYGFNQRIRAIFMLSENHHYLGGLVSLSEFRDGKYWDLGEKDERLRVRVEDIKQDKRGRIWLGTRGSGLGIMIGDSLKFLNKEDGLSSNLVNKIFILKNEVFVATNKGLDRIVEDSKGEMFVNSIFNRRRGSFSLIDNVFETKGGIIVQNGDELTFLGDDYLANPNFKPSLILTDFRVDGKSQILDTSKIFSLYPEQKNVGFSFRINTLQNENHPALFQFRLIGLYPNWQSSFEPEILFNGLEAGEYRFEVKVKEFNNNWSEISKVSFFIAKPFYLQLWFVILMTALFAAGFFFYLRFRTHQEARSKELISSNINALKNQMNPHFIFNALNSIQYFIVTNQRREANIFLAKLSDLVRNVLNTTNESSISLDDEISRIQDYVQLEQMRLSDSFKFRIENPQNLATQNFQIPPMLIQPLVENAIWHGLSDVENGGEIILKMKLKGTDLRISVSDNGHGMNIEAWEKDPENSGKGNSIGLINVKQRMALLSKIRKRDYSLKFRNLEKSPRKGTKVVLKIPQ